MFVLRARERTKLKTMLGPHIPESQLRLLAVAKILSGELPRLCSHRITLTYGRGEKCAICGTRIQARQAEYTLTESCPERDIRFHLNCHRAWQLECLVNRAD